MNEPLRLMTPLSDEDVRRLRAGDRALLSGVVYTGRDAAHKRLFELLQAGEELPVDLRGQVIYYVGPTPAKPGRVIGSAGPTTSGRMDAYAPALIAYGLRGMIGKGLRSQPVIDAMTEHGAVYFGATGGAAALLARKIVSCEIVAYEDLGTEAIRRLVVDDLPVTVINDAYGGDFYREGVKAYERSPGGA
ncbi:MAG: Fe-S-containing hydro-lyase [Armatimonadetes bacterium]|nr:Fe-S-containing hydro-lyase [Armatimonadota bacterium]